MAAHNSQIDYHGDEHDESEGFRLVPSCVASTALNTVIVFIPF